MRVYPKSFFVLLLGGLALVTAPLLAGITMSAAYTDRLADQAQSALYRAFQATQASRQLATLLQNLERSARQFVILGDNAVREAYLGLHERFDVTAQRLAGLPFDAEQRASLEQLLRIEQSVFAAMSAPEVKAAAIEPLVGGFRDAGELAERIIARSDALIERESKAMVRIAEEARQALLWQLATALVLAIVVVYGVTLLLLRPVRQLDSAIRQLGAGQLGASVRVSGPADLERLGERLEWLRREWLSIEAQKNRFLRQVAHALKTPLSAVRESTDLLAEGAHGTLSATQRELLDILRRNSLELQRLIEDLLLLGEADFRRLSLNVETVALEPLIDAARQAHALSAGAKRLHVAIESTVPRLRADPDKLRVILDNLLSNAIKHSPEGGTITVSAQSVGATVVICVQDQGPGIAAEDRERVFDPFYQGRTSGTGAVKGSGVGLSIVREYATAHGGTVDVAARSGCGACVCVTLPDRPEMTDAKHDPHAARR